MNAQKKLADAKELGLKRGYVLGFYIGAIQALQYELKPAVEIEILDKVAMANLGLGGTFNQIARQIVKLDMSYERYLKEFAGLFQRELFSDDEFGRQYTEAYHMLCDHYDADIPLDDGSVLACFEESPFKNPDGKSPLVQ